MDSAPEAFALYHKILPLLQPDLQESMDQPPAYKPAAAVWEQSPANITLNSPISSCMKPVVQLHLPHQPNRQKNKTWLPQRSKPRQTVQNFKFGSFL